MNLKLVYEVSFVLKHAVVVLGVRLISDLRSVDTVRARHHTFPSPWQLLLIHVYVCVQEEIQ